MSVIDSLPFSGRDERTRKFLLPRRILKISGKVENPEKLLADKPLQIGLSELHTTNLINKNPGEPAGVLLDYGCELHGGIRLLNAAGNAGGCVQVRLRFGESAGEALSEIGEKNAVNDHTVRDMTVTIPPLSDQEFGQTGFRFVFIQLLTPEAILPLKAALAVFIYRDLEYKGSFRCSDPLLNRIYDTAAYTCHLNMQGMLWDGIKRDRLVWIGDMHPEALTIRSVFGAHPLVEESLDFIRLQTPLPGWMNGLPSYSMWWIIILWDWYLYSGSAVFLARQRDYALTLIRQLTALVDEKGQDQVPVYFFDWPTDGTPAAQAGVRALLFLSLEKAYRLAGFYGDTETAALCKEKYQALRLRDVPRVEAKSVTAFQALAGFLDCAEAAQRITQDGAAGMCTFLSYYILKAASQGGRMAEALHMLRAYYGAMLDKGATSFWEDLDLRWLENTGRIDELPTDNQRDLHGDNGIACYTGFRHSLCHGWASGPVPFLAEEVLGIKVLEPGCRRIALEPQLGDLDWAEGSYPTPHGILTVSHRRRSDGSVDSQVQAPDSVEVITI